MSLFDFHIHIQGDYTEIDKKLNKIYSSIKLIHIEMAKKSDFDALNERLAASHAEISDALTNLADDVRRLTEGLTPAGGLTEAEAIEVFSALDAKATQIEDVASQIRALADQTPEPIDPPVDPEPEI